jgi:hypothetical protein
MNYGHCSWYGYQKPPNALRISRRERATRSVKKAMISCAKRLAAMPGY